MSTVLRSLHRAGEYSWVLVVPKSWFEALGQPKVVTVEVGRKRLIVRPLKEEGVSDDES